MSLIVFGLVILTVILNIIAQVSLKAGMIQIGEFSFTWENLGPILYEVVVSPWIIFGVLVYAISVFVWLMVLSRTPVSVAYPMSSLGYIASAIAGYYFWSEDLNPIRVAGILVILLGVYLIAKN